MYVEINQQFVEANSSFIVGNTRVMVTPPIDEDYWVVRVRLSKQQAIVAFPKFGTFGVGFQVEDDWNTNLLYTCSAEEIFDHISHNKGDDSISDESYIEAIRLIQQAVATIKNSQSS